jgi:signal recognition particle receptor subunit alpha
MLDYSQDSLSDLSSLDKKPISTPTTTITTTPTNTLSTDFFIQFQKNLSTKEIDPVLLKMREHLISKNVAAEIASHICDHVRTQLMGQSISAFTSLQSKMKLLLNEAILRILTPKTCDDLLRDIHAIKASRPFVLTFIGVNGVGKSTNLSKVAFWLLSSKLKILIAACDTFRSGAVEQLKVHVRNLKSLEQGATIDLYDRGYGKDPAGIAQEAIAFGNLFNHF